MEKRVYIHRILSDVSSEIAWFLLNVSGEVLACNHFSAELFKYKSAQDLIGVSLRELVPREFASNLPPEITIEHLTNGLFLERINRCADETLIATLIKTSFIELDNEIYVECFAKADDAACESAGTRMYKQLNELLKCEVMRLKNIQNPSKEMTYFQHDLAIELAKRHEDLKARDFIFFSLVLAGVQTKEIADILCITTDSAYKYRKRLRKKIGLSAEQDLYEYLQEVMLAALS